MQVYTCKRTCMLHYTYCIVLHCKQEPHQLAYIYMYYIHVHILYVDIHKTYTACDSNYSTHCRRYTCMHQWQVSDGEIHVHVEPTCTLYTHVHVSTTISLSEVNTHAYLYIGEICKCYHFEERVSLYEIHQSICTCIYIGTVLPASPHSSCVNIYIHTCTCVIVVPWFLQCMGYVLREGCMYFRGWSPRKYIHTARGRYYPMHCIQIDRIMLTTRLATALECLYYSTYCVLAVRRKVLYARRCSYS